MPLKSKPKRKTVFYKIQIASVHGYADVKSSDDDENYHLDLYRTKADAVAEMHDLSKMMGGESDYRVVPSTTPADDELYD